jgi:hypothetical protein
MTEVSMMNSQIGAALLLSNRARARKIVRELSFRHLPWCAAWAALVLVSVLACYFAGGNVQLLAVFGFFYAVQAFVAEWKGVTVSLDRIAAPRRSWRMWDIAVIWRVEGSPTDVRSMVALRCPDANIVELTWAGGERVRLVFANRDRKLEFFEVVRRFKPNIRIIREGPAPH